MAEPGCPRGSVAAAACALAVGLITAGAGCRTGSLATSTDDGAGGEWSVAPRQRAHVGETVEFSFMLTEALGTEPIHAFGVADYCTFRIGDRRMDTDIDNRGGFRTRCTMDRYAAGDSVKVSATAYRERDARDQMLIAGEWITNESPNNKPDDFVATASLRLDVYQSHVRIVLPPNADGYDFSTARMILRRADGSRTMVFEHRPPRTGFAVSPQAGGGWLVDYAPAGDEVNHSGTTDVEFSVYDRANNRHVQTVEIETP